MLVSPNGAWVISMQKKKPIKRYQIVIIGAGMVGSALAVMLAKLGFKVALLEKQVASNMSASSQPNRVVALSYLSKKLLQALGVWDNLAAQPYYNMLLQDRQTEIALSEQQPLGYIVENNTIINSLLNIVRAQQNKIQAETEVDSSADSEANTTGSVELFDQLQSFCLRLNGESKLGEIELEENILHADLVIGADGANSYVRNKLGIKTKHKFYSQRALVTEVSSSARLFATAIQFFSSSGTLAFLPLANKNRYSIVWSVSEEDAELLLSLTKEDFASKLQQESQGKLGTLELLKEVLSFPLQTAVAHSYGVEGALLVGDAAHVIHPMAGYGVNLGFMDVLSLGQLLLKYKGSLSLGSLHNILAYQRECRANNTMWLSLVDFLQHFFLQETGFLGKVRQLATNLAVNSFWIKKHIVNFARGDKDRYAELLRFLEDKA